MSNPTTPNPIDQSKPQGISWKDAKAELLKDPALKKAYDRFDLWYELGKRWINFKIWLKGKK
jgi:hypothetical protein